jgi:CubicO group peptidase (beta-lactamase class C family)
MGLRAPTPVRQQCDDSCLLHATQFPLFRKIAMHLSRVVVRYSIAGAVVLVASVVPTGARCQGLPRARPADVGLDSAALARIGPAMQSYVDSAKLPGIVAAVARHGKIAYVSSVGYLDADARTPMRPDVVMRIYSMTKPVVAVAIMQLVERKKIALDDPVSRFIPAFGATGVYAGGGALAPQRRPPDRPITIKDLLMHTAGLTYGIFGNTSVDSIVRAANLYRPDITLERFADSLATLPLLFSPGTAWNYSLATDVLGRVVEVASGRRLDRYLDEEIFAPLGMDETSFHMRPAFEGRLASVHGRTAAGLHRVPRSGPETYDPDARFFSGGGGLLSTIDDYFRFAQMLLNGGELGKAHIVSRQTVALMTKNQLAPALVPIPRRVAGQAGYGWGLGMAVLVDSAAEGVPAGKGVYRWNGAANTYFWVDPANDLIGMVWTQYFPYGGLKFDVEFQRLVYQAMTR